MNTHPRRAAATGRGAAEPAGVGQVLQRLAVDFDLEAILQGP